MKKEIIAKLQKAVDLLDGVKCDGNQNRIRMVESINLIAQAADMIPMDKEEVTNDGNSDS